MNWKKEYKTVWEQLSDKVSLVAIHYVWVNHHSIPIFFWKRWGDFCDSYRSLVWAYLMKQFNVGGWERYSEIIDKFELEWGLGCLFLYLSVFESECQY